MVGRKTDLRLQVHISMEALEDDRAAELNRAGNRSHIYIGAATNLRFAAFTERMVYTCKAVACIDLHKITGFAVD